MLIWICIRRIGQGSVVANSVSDLPARHASIDNPPLASLKQVKKISSRSFGVKERVPGIQ